MDKLGIIVDNFSKIVDKSMDIVDNFSMTVDNFRSNVVRLVDLIKFDRFWAEF